MTKKQREQVYNKYNGHCAYCGRIIEYKEMQVDHLIPKLRGCYTLIKKLDHIDNLMPSCRRCNHYKRALDLDQFRYRIAILNRKIHDTYLAKVAVDFGLIEFKPFKGLFYFESYNKSLNQTKG